MKNQDKPTSPSEAAEQAAEWFIRLKDGRLTAADERDYLLWLKQSPVHIAEMLRVSRVYGVLHTSKLREMLPEAMLGDTTAGNVVQLSPGEHARKPAPTLVHRPRKFLTRARTAVAAVLLAGLGVALVVHGVLGNHSISTGPGEWRQITLDDNSVVKIGPRTELNIEFTTARRSVDLRSGEATFQVAKDSTRPFVVRAAETRVQAVGTEFGVARKEDTVVVTVAEGKVAVSRELSDQTVPLSAGEQLRIARANPVLSQVKRVNVAQELAWVDRRVIFENAVVADAVREFNRRNRMQIRVDVPEIEHMPVRAMFNAADPESFADFLATAAGVRVVRESKDLLVLEVRQ